MYLDKLSYRWRKWLSPFYRQFNPKHSYCHRCKVPWSNITSHSTMYDETSGCFPLCVSCWKELETPKARLPFYLELWYSWHRWGKPDVEWETIKTAVLEGR